MQVLEDSKIIDLSDKANQPMFYNNRYLIIFKNYGEIYNYLEKKHADKKYKFKTKSDTEVILVKIMITGGKNVSICLMEWSLLILWRDIKN